MAPLLRPEVLEGIGGDTLTELFGRLVLDDVV
jgi:hypothetical protein